MFSSAPIARKRAHDADDEFASVHVEKRLRSTAGQEHGNSGSYQLSPSLAGAEGDSLRSTVSDTDSSDMDMDMDTADDFEMRLSHSPEQPASWPLKRHPIRNPRMALDDQGTRIPTPTVLAPFRPKPRSSQNSLVAAATSLRPDLSVTKERLPSPISEDEPHTPTTAAGSQLSLLSVNDMDLDTDQPQPSRPESMARKQRARSGAFTSSRDPSKKFSMGYRADCDKCLNRVPGHMNHLLES